MFLSKGGKNLAATEDFSDYTYTAQILRKHFYNEQAKIERFLQIAKASGITLDPFFLGLIAVSKNTLTLSNTITTFCVPAV